MTVQDSTDFLQTVEGEISFFRSIMRARPIGIHRHFHVLAIRNAIHRDTGHFVSADDIWNKLRTCYDLEALENIDLELDAYGSPSSNNSTPIEIRSPSPSQNLGGHPFFKEEYTLPVDESYESLITARRLRATVSAPSSPDRDFLPSLPQTKKGRSKGKGRGVTTTRRGKSKLDLAGLVGGDSDSSALTQESGDEGGHVASTPRESVVTGTDAGTDYAEGDDVDVEIHDPSPAPSASSKPARTKGKAVKKSTTARTRATASSSRPAKKRKR